MKKLARWAAMLAAPTLITSWCGMNFVHMPELEKSWAYTAIACLVACIVGCISVTILLDAWTCGEHLDHVSDKLSDQVAIVGEIPFFEDRPVAPFQFATSFIRVHIKLD
ncbi:putative membrane protein [Luteibacter sp. 3190]|nr:putative membrane protein [Luteibacter sp. 3190]